MPDTPPSLEVGSRTPQPLSEIKPDEVKATVTLKLALDSALERKPDEIDSLLEKKAGKKRTTTVLSENGKQTAKTAYEELQRQSPSSETTIAAVQALRERTRDEIAGARSQHKTAYQEYRRLNIEADRARKAGDTTQESILRQNMERVSEELTAQEQTLRALTTKSKIISSVNQHARNDAQKEQRQHIQQELKADTTLPKKLEEFWQETVKRREAEGKPPSRKPNETLLTNALTQHLLKERAQAQSETIDRTVQTARAEELTGQIEQKTTSRLQSLKDKGRIALHALRRPARTALVAAGAVAIALAPTVLNTAEAYAPTQDPAVTRQLEAAEQERARQLQEQQRIELVRDQIPNFSPLEQKREQNLEKVLQEYTFTVNIDGKEITVATPFAESNATYAGRYPSRWFAEGTVSSKMTPKQAQEVVQEAEKSGLLQTKVKEKLGTKTSTSEVTPEENLARKNITSDEKFAVYETIRRDLGVFIDCNGLVYNALKYDYEKRHGAGTFDNLVRNTFPDLRGYAQPAVYFGNDKFTDSRWAENLGNPAVKDMKPGDVIVITNGEKPIHSMIVVGVNKDNGTMQIMQSTDETKNQGANMLNVKIVDPEAPIEKQQFVETIAEGTTLTDVRTGDSMGARFLSTPGAQHPIVRITALNR